MELNKIYQGHALDVLRGFPDGVFDACITSPPYWSLRCYNTDPIVWSGDSDCDHEWGMTIDNPKYDDRPPELKRQQGARAGTSITSENWAKGNCGNFCAKCGAWLGSLGLEPTFQLYIDHLVEIFAECKRVLKNTGVMWINIGDSYVGSSSGQVAQTIHNIDGASSSQKRINGKLNGIPAKSLIDIPYRLSIALIDRLGLVKRNTVIWHKVNCMPASCKDRFTVDFEYVYVFTKSQKYYFEQQFEPLAEATIPRMSRGISANNKWSNGASGQTRQGMNKPRANIKKMAGTKYGGDGKGLHSGYYDYDGTPRFSTMGRNKRCVWSIPTKSLKEKHYASFPDTLIEPMISASVPEFICNKCGKPREKVFDKDTINTRPGINVLNGKSGQSDDPNSDFHKSSYSIYRQRKFVTGFNYTDCGCSEGFHAGVVLDPFMGSGTVALVAKKMNRNYVGIELNEEYIEMSHRRLDEIEDKQLKLF